MIIFIYVVILALNILLLIIRKRNTVVTLLSVFFAVYAYFISDGAADFIAYKSIYDGAWAEDSFEIGYRFLMHLGHFFKMDFLAFQGVICTLSLFLLLVVFSKFSKNYHLFFSLYLIYQYFYDLVVLRNHLCFTIISIALLYLFRNRKLRYLLLLGIATLFHKSALFYFPLVFMNFRSSKIVWKFQIIAVIAVIISGITFFLSRSTNLIISIVNRIPFISDDKLVYFDRSVNFGFIPHYILHLGTIAIFILFSSNNAIRECMRKDRAFLYLYRFCYCINLYVMISFPFMIYNLTFFRLFNGVFLFNYIFYAVTLDKFRQKKKRYYKILTGVLLVNGLYFVPYVHASGQRMQILQAISNKIRR